MSFTVAVAAGGPVAQATTSPIVYSWSGGTGTLYVLVVSRNGATDTTTAVTDSAGNTWNLVHFAPASGSTGRHIEHWYCVPVSAFTSVTITFSGTSGTQALPLVVTGQATSSLVNAQNSGFSAATTTPAEMQLTPTVTGCLEISSIQANTNNHSTQVSAEVGWTKLSTQSAGPAVAYRVNSGSGSADGCTWTLTTSVGSGSSIVAYAPGASTGPAVTVWNGTSEVHGAVTFWNGTSEVAATVSSVV